MKVYRQRITSFLKNTQKKLGASKKLPVFTLSFTLAALIVTIVAVQQQQTLIQEAAQREECEDDTTAVTGGNTRVTLVITDNPTATVSRGSSAVGSTVSENERNKAKNGIPGQLLVKYKDGKDKKSAEDKVKKRKGKLKKRNDRIRVDVMQVPENEEVNTINDLRNDPNVEYVERDFPLYPLFTPNDANYGQQYALNNEGQAIGQTTPKTGKADIDIDAPEAWEKTQGGVVVAVIDSGIDQNHPDLKGKIKSFKNFTGTSDEDKLGHGTFVSGIIAASTNNSKGIAGVCPECTLLNAKVISDETNNVQSAEWMADAIHWAVDQGAKVINISIASPSRISVIEDAVNYAYEHNVVVVAGAGNCGDDNFGNNNCTTKNPIMYPAGYENAIAVSSVDNQGKKASGSESGDWVDVSAPGVDILSTTPTKQYLMGQGKGSLNYGYFSGTSFSSPQVAGVAGLIMSQGATASEARNKIENTSTALPGNGSSHGLVNANNAVNGGTTTPNNPSTTKAPKPTKVAKPSCKPKKDKGDKTKKTPTPVKTNPNRVPSDPEKAACKMLPNLSFCNNANNPPKNNGTNTGCPTNTKSNGSGGTTNSGDINTGGKTGGNNKTDININQNGQNQTSDQSGGNGNSPGGCGDGNDKTKDNANDKKNSNSNSGGKQSLICRFMPRLNFCQEESKRNDENKKREDDKKKKDAEDKKKKDDEAKKKKDEENKKKNVKGATDNTVRTIIQTCIGESNPSICTPDMRAVADINGDTQINQLDYNLYVNNN